MSEKEQLRSNSELLISRRHFLYGALGAGVLAVGLGGFAAPGKAFAASSDVVSLDVPEDAVFTQADCTQVDAAECVAMLGSFELPYGTLLWTNGDAFAACLFPTETAKPLTQAGYLNLKSGYWATLLEAAIGADEGFDIYDIRLNDHGAIWTEANIFSNVWRVYTAVFADNVLGAATKVDEGDGDWETPTIAAVGGNAFWQVLPDLNGTMTTEDSLLKKAAFGNDSSDVVYSSTGRMSTPIYPLYDSLVITPRTDTDLVHYQLTLLDAQTGDTKDQLVLPQAMRPLEAGWGNTGFIFSFDGIYDYGGGIANLGTYTPQSIDGPGDYEGKTWFQFNRSPTAPSAWFRNTFVVKSTQSVCGIDLVNKTYFTIDVESGSDNYGDYLASTGMNGSIVTFANVDSKSIDGTESKYTLVRVWAPIR